MLARFLLTLLPHAPELTPRILTRVSEIVLQARVGTRQGTIVWSKAAIGARTSRNRGIGIGMNQNQERKAGGGLPIRYLLVLWLFILSTIAFLDRTNISIAGPE